MRKQGDPNLTRLRAMTRIIFLEDEPVLREELAEFLQAQGHFVTPVASLAEFKQAFVPMSQPQGHLIAVIDLGLPDGNGLDLINQLRAGGHRLGIIVLTARITLREKVAGLIGGADHYLPKGNDLDELAATVAALARRLGDDAARPCWVLQASPRQLTPPGFEPIELSAQDFTVLHVLMQAVGTADGSASREAIVAALGEDFFSYDQRRLDTQMRRLRRKVLDACGIDLPVSTLRGVGFHFHAEVALRA